MIKRVFKRNSPDSRNLILNFFRGILFDNFAIKFMAFVISIFIWMIVLNSKTVTESVDVPIVLSKPENMLVVNEIPDTVTVLFSGSKAFLRNVLNRKYTIEIDAANLKEGTSLIRVPYEQINLPRNVRITRVTPSQFAARLEERVEKTVPVRLATKGELPGEEIIKNVEVDPFEVTVSGPSNLLKDLNIVRTEPVDLSDIHGATTRELSLVLPDSKLVIATVNRVVAKFDVSGGISNIFRLKNIPVIRVGKKKKITPAVVTVVVRTSLDKISTKLANQIRVVVDLNELSGSYKGKVSLDVKLPDELSLVRVEPSEVRVE